MTTFHCIYHCACKANDNCNGCIAGVADGVGGWRSYGVDPSQFPNSLMATCERLVRLGHFRPHTPKDIIQSSYQEVLQNKAPLVGRYQTIIDHYCHGLCHASSFHLIFIHLIRIHLKRSIVTHFTLVLLSY